LEFIFENNWWWKFIFEEKGPFEISVKKKLIFEIFGKKTFGKLLAIWYSNVNQ